MKLNLFIFLIIVLNSCTTKSLINDKEKSIEDTTQIDLNTETIYYDTSYSVDGNMLIFEYEEKDDIIGKWKAFYSNGIIKETGQLDDKFGCGMNDGLFNFYDTLGVLIQTKNFYNWLEHSQDDCHSTRQDITVTDFYKNGSIKAETFYETSYEGEEFKSGKWIFYDEKGKIINSEIHKSHYTISNFNL